MEPEVVFNLWVFVQSIGPMHVIHGLGVRSYVMSGSDDEMTKLLKELAVSDFHFARRFPLPDRYYLNVSEEDGVFRASSGDTAPTGKKVRKGLALVRPDISGMHQMEYFKEALDVAETSLPSRPLGVNGAKARVPTVNRKNLLSVITTVNVDSNGNQVALVDSPYKAEPPKAAICLWAFNDDQARAIYAVSGRGYMLHGSNSDKTRALKALALNDYSMATALPIAESMSANVNGVAKKGVLAASPGDTYSKSLFDDVFQSIENEIPAMIGVDGKIKNKTSIKARDLMVISTQVTEHADKAAATTSIKLIDSPDPAAPANQAVDTPQPVPATQVAERAGKAPGVIAAKLLDDPVATPVRVGTTNVAQEPAARRTLLQRLFGR